MLQTERLVREYLTSCSVVCQIPLPVGSSNRRIYLDHCSNGRNVAKIPHVFVCFGYLIFLVVTEGRAFHWNSAWKSHGNVKQKLNSSWNFR